MASSGSKIQPGALFHDIQKEFTVKYCELIKALHFMNFHGFVNVFNPVSEAKNQNNSCSRVGGFSSKNYTGKK